ncbi:MAG: lectin like domain-containing protein [Holophagales bacterium]|nr:lectin like domain-containing protein [Holophagales bacterium]
MNAVFAAALCLFSASALLGQSDQGPALLVQAAPLNPAFVKWQEAQKERKARIALGLPADPMTFGQADPYGWRFGYIPDPCLPPTPKAPLTQSEALVKAGLATFQPINDPRTWLPSGLPPGISPIRNQGKYGTCWAFSSIAALEYALYKAGTPMELSEWHLSYFAYNPISGFPAFTKDPVESGKHETFDQGGNFSMAQAIMSRGDLAGGPVPRASSTYAGALPLASTPSVATISEALLFKTASPDTIKGLVQEYGVVAISMFWPDIYSQQYDSSTYSFRYVQSDEPKTNHGVNIVGWDDTWPKSKFPAGNQPSTDGAWIVRNSWGPLPYPPHDDGYFYMSYDTTISYIGVYSGFTEVDAKTYQHDMHGRVIGYRFASQTTWMSNIFKATANHSIKAVAFYTVGEGATYEIYVKKGVGGNPNTGTLALGPQSGTLKSPGYHRVPLSSPISVSADEKFAVIVKATDLGDWPFSVSEAYEGFSDSATATLGVGWISLNGSNWYDATDVLESTSSICLKAFADDGTETPDIRVSVTPKTVSLQPGQTQTFTATVTGTTNQTVVWSTNGGSITAAGVYTAPAVAGTYTVTAISVVDASHPGTATVTVAAASAISVSVTPKTISLQPGKTQLFTANVTGTSNNAVTWFVSSGQGTITQAGLYTAPAIADTYTVTAISQADTSKSDTATVAVSAASIVFTSIPKALFVNGTAQLQAVADGLDNTAVKWDVPSGQGTITQAGAYTAPATVPSGDGRATITATSDQAPDLNRQAWILIRPLDFANFGSDNNTKTNPQLLGLAHAFGSKSGDPEYDQKYDINGDGFIDDDDLAMLFKIMGWLL